MKSDPSSSGEPSSSSASSCASKPPLPPTNPLDTAPSSPSQIYLNLLILEASLRSQYLHHIARRRKFTFFLAILCIWIVSLGYGFFILGGSPYYYVSHLERLGLGGGVVTGVLYYATGLYHKTIVEPRRFVFIANRGLRGFNVKLVKVSLSSGEWLRWWWSWYTFRPLASRPNSSPRHKVSLNGLRRPTQPLTHATAQQSNQSPSLYLEHIDAEDDVEEYLPGGLHIKLVILPKGFSPDFREGWEIYRAEYWEKENEARQARLLRLKVGSKAKNTDTQQHEKRIRRASRSASVSSHRGRTPTPEPEAVPLGRKRKGSAASLKRRSVISTVKSGAPGDISDSGSTTSAIGDPERSRRLDGPKGDIATNSVSSLQEGSQKLSTRDRRRRHSGHSSPLQAEEVDIVRRIMQ